MKRRIIIKSLATFGSLAMLPKAVISNFITQKKPLHLIGIGGAGTNTLEYIFRKGMEVTYTCINDTQRLHQPPGINFMSFAPPAKSAIENATATYSHSTMETFVTIPQSIKEIFTPKQRYILLAGLGGYVGTCITVALCKHLYESEISFSIICNYPFAFEGLGRASIANDGLKKLKVYDYCKCFYNDDLKTKYGSLKLSEAFEKASEKVYNICMSDIYL